MKRNKGIVTILVGVGILFISIFFSSGSYPELDYIGKISKMEVVLYQGKYIMDLNGGHTEGEIAIPLKFPLSLSVVLVLIGTGVLLISKNKETNG